MKKVIRLTEAELHKLVTETVKRIIHEDGMMGGATAGATSASADRVGAYDVPFGEVQRRKIYSPKKKSGGSGNIDMTPALKRHDGEGGSISMNHAETKKK